MNDSDKPTDSRDDAAEATPVRVDLSFHPGHAVPTPLVPSVTVGESVSPDQSTNA